MSTSDEKKAPPYMERLHKEHCIYETGKYGTFEKYSGALFAA